MTRHLFDFHGGIHPSERKDISRYKPIRTIPIPDRLILPLQQHKGHPAVPCVKKRDYVLKGQLIAEPKDMVSVGLNAPTSGTILSIDNHLVPHPSGLSDLCIIIEPDHRDKWCQLTPCDNYQELSPEEIRSRIRYAGIVGMGGAGFPTEIKLHPPKASKVNTLIINGAECEPYITADDLLMRERAEEVIQGIEMMSWLLQPTECLLAVENNKPEAIKALSSAAKYTRIEIIPIPVKYPSGSEKQLIKILTGKEVPVGKIPANIGILCQNVATAAAVYHAIRLGMPLISRITTLTGDAIEQPGNYDVLLGTPIPFLLESAGYQAQHVDRLIMGGSMTGFTLHNANVPIVKNTHCLIAASRNELPLPPQPQACIRCGMCAEVCPSELLPQQLYWFARSQEFEKAEQHHLFDCIECGACSWVCPSAIPLVQYYRFSKGQIRQQKENKRKSDQARQRFEFRQYRQARNTLEKEQRRKARAETAAQAKQQSIRKKNIEAPKSKTENK